MLDTNSRDRGIYHRPKVSDRQRRGADANPVASSIGTISLAA